MTLDARAIRPAPLVAADFAPFGTVIGWQEGRPATPINGGTSLRMDLLTELALGAAGGQPCLALFRAQARRWPLPIVELERHRLGAQLFIPLGALRFVVVVAAASRSAPTGADLRAFFSDGTQGVVLAPGTWHHALIAVDAGDFVVIERRSDAVDCDVVQLAPSTVAAPLLQLD